jgi:hypothetical protein
LYGGDNPRYTDGAVANAALITDVYSGWWMWVYHDQTAPQWVLDTIGKLPHVRLVEMSHDTIVNQMSWKFLIASDERVDRYVFRDIDSRLTARERYAVDEWVSSGRAFHVMRDHPSHSNYAMSGGMWGGTRGAIPQMATLIRSSRITADYVQDMNFLNKKVWSVVKRDVLQHDSFSCQKYGGGRPFPRSRIGGEHVGGVVLNGTLRQIDVDLLLAAKQPAECTVGTTAPTTPPPPTAPLPPTPPQSWTRIVQGAPGSNTGCGGPCIWDDAFCTTFPGVTEQCAMLEVEAELKCGSWSACAGVVCRTDYGGHCFARGQMSRMSSSSMWGYRKEAGSTTRDGEGGYARPLADSTTTTASHGPEPGSASPLPSASPSLTVWSNDFHISTIGNVKKLLQPQGVVFIDKSLSGACAVTQTCAKNLKVLTSANGISPSRRVMDRFVASYRSDPELRSADVVMCFHPAAMCELFMPLNKALFVIATTRYEMGRESAATWLAWNANLKTIAADPRNLVAANNRYDAEYIRYFTGISAIILPSVIQMDERYRGSTDTILIAPLHSPGATKLQALAQASSPLVIPIAQKYPGRYTYIALCNVTAIVHLPYQLSTMSFFEQYAMGIPLLVPTPEFLWDLHDEFDLVTERTWHRVRTSRRPHMSVIGPAEGMVGVPDPNDDRNRTAFVHWARFGDWYTWPHIVQFNSWSDLGAAINHTDWHSVSTKMLQHNKATFVRVQHELYLRILATRNQTL